MEHKDLTRQIKQRMHQAGPQQWLANLQPGLEQTRARLSQRDPADLARRSACRYDRAAHVLTIPFWGQPHTLGFPELVARDANGQPARLPHQILLLMYLERADGEPRAGRWLAYRELPGGLFYAQAFHGYAERRLARAFDGDLDAFGQAARRLDGRALQLGQAALEFVVLPRVHLASVYWLGDQDLPHNASVLFDAAASHYLSVDALAVLGSQLVSRLIRIGQGRPPDEDESLTGVPFKRPAE